VYLIGMTSVETNHGEMSQNKSVCPWKIKSPRFTARRTTSRLIRDRRSYIGPYFFFTKLTDEDGFVLYLCRKRPRILQGTSTILKCIPSGMTTFLAPREFISKRSVSDRMCIGPYLWKQTLITVHKKTKYIKCKFLQHSTQEWRPLWIVLRRLQ
jgi:hypothetical protein